MMQVSSPPGSSLLGAKCFSMLAHIGRYIAAEVDGTRWNQVKLPTAASTNLLEEGKKLYIR